jgi:hypothetical protein
MSEFSCHPVWCDLVKETDVPNLLTLDLTHWAVLLFASRGAYGGVDPVARHPILKVGTVTVSSDGTYLGEPVDLEGVGDNLAVVGSSDQVRNKLIDERVMMLIYRWIARHENLTHRFQGQQHFPFCQSVANWIHSKQETEFNQRSRAILFCRMWTSSTRGGMERVSTFGTQSEKIPRRLCA